MGLGALPSSGARDSITDSTLGQVRLPCLLIYDEAVASIEKESTEQYSDEDVDLGCDRCDN